MNFIVDAMGGDHAPYEIVLGCIEAVNEAEGFLVTIVGDSKKITEILDKNKHNTERIIVVHADEVITSTDLPIKAIKTKKNSSMVLGYKMLKEKTGDVFISAGNTGAVLAGAMLLLGRIDGVDRPALTVVFPTKTGPLLLLDAGSNTMCKPINLLQFGIMGSIFMKEVYGIEAPKVGLVNVGTEENKGTDTVKQAYQLLSKSHIRFHGNVEGRDILDGIVDIAVCDGFVGNVILKLTEGMTNFFFSSIKEIYKKNAITKISSFAVKDGFSEFKKKLDYEEYGGVPLLGVNGRVIKCHGSAHAKSIKNSIKYAVKYTQSTVLKQIEEEFSNMEVESFGE